MWVTIQKVPGRGPCFLMRNVPVVLLDKWDGISDCLSGLGSGLRVPLTFQNIPEEDEADYICGAACGRGSRFL